MIEAFRKIWRFAGTERANINKSVAVKFLNAVFHMLEVSAIYFVIVALTEEEIQFCTYGSLLSGRKQHFKSTGRSGEGSGSLSCVPYG